MKFGQSGKACIAWLADVAARDPAALAAAPGPADRNVEAPGLDARSHSLVCLAGWMAAGNLSEPATADGQHVAAALDHGVTLGEIVGVFVALLPTVGTERIAAAAQAVLSALGRGTADISASGHPERA